MLINQDWHTNLIVKWMNSRNRLTIQREVLVYWVWSITARYHFEHVFDVASHVPTELFKITSNVTLYKIHFD